MFSASKVSKQTLQFIRLVTQKGRINLIRMICDAIELIHKSRQNIMDAEIVSAAELKKSQLKNIRTYLERTYDKTIELTVTINPDLIGGFQIRVNHQLIDMSVKNPD